MNLSDADHFFADVSSSLSLAPITAKEDSLVGFKKKKFVYNVLLFVPDINN